ncbi:MAG: nucleotidyltransferase domain-containing protein [Alphaproteobacteria bacterium]
MALSKFESSISQEFRATIISEIAQIEEKHYVEVLFAIESGSRAWGFPSPDSDYDVRFVYQHPKDWYLSLLPKRDVIELPIDDELDISGWDLRKTLNLLLKPNPVALEWIRSPIHYKWSPKADLLNQFAVKLNATVASHYHYWHLGQGQWNRSIADKSEVKLKKYFYVLRPALALCWLRNLKDKPLPMNLQELVNGLTPFLEPDFINLIGELIEQKSVTRELGLGPRIAELDKFIVSEFGQGQNAPSNSIQQGLRQEADELFLKLVS